MSLDLSRAFESEIASATNQIEMAKQALATEEDREQAELLRFRIRNLGKWLEALKANHTAVILAEDKVRKWKKDTLGGASSASLRAAPGPNGGARSKGPAGA